MEKWSRQEDISMKNRRTILFAGTTEGHQMIKAFAKHQRPLLVCVATEYGKTLIEEDCNLTDDSIIEIRAGRLDWIEMETLLRMENPIEVLDATHPYAKIVSEQLRTLSDQYHLKYTRIIREQRDLSKKNSCLIVVENMEAAAQKVKHISGPILLTTGSKEIGTFCAHFESTDSIYARVLPSTESIDLCLKAGLKQQNIIGMQGPFTVEMNRALIKNYHICGMITKESGAAGGFDEKYQACMAENIPFIVIARPDEKEEGIFCDVFLKQLFGECSIEPGNESEEKRTLALVGIGTGKADGITEYAKKKLVNAQVIFGARRMLAFCKKLTVHADFVEAYQPEVVNAYLTKHGEIKRAAVALSGDVGFFSGAKKMIDEIENYKIELVPGISIVEGMAARFALSWDDMKLVSCHGKDKNPIPFILRYPKCLFLLGSAEQLRNLAQECADYQLEAVKFYVAVNLDGEGEVVRMGTSRDFTDFSSNGIITVIVENEQFSNKMDLDLKDERFVRKDAPMTKREVRTLSIAKLNLSTDSVVIDVGTGTGSVGIGCAKIAYDGMVYGIEKEEKHLELLLENKRLLQVPNFIPLIGDGVDLIPTLPKATHAFVGGSSGKMDRILDLLYQNNPSIVIVINGITLETVSSVLEYGRKNQLKVDCVEIYAASTRQVGHYHMLQGNNPIFILSLEPEV